MPMGALQRVCVVCIKHLDIAMDVLIVIGAALLAGLLLVGIAAKLVVELGLLAVAASAVIAIASFWLSAIVGAAAFFGIVRLIGESRVGWAIVGGLLAGAVVWVVIAMAREISRVPQRWRRFVAGAHFGCVSQTASKVG